MRAAASCSKFANGCCDGASANKHNCLFKSIKHTLCVLCSSFSTNSLHPIQTMIGLSPTCSSQHINLHTQGGCLNESEARFRWSDLRDLSVCVWGENTTSGPLLGSIESQRLLWIATGSFTLQFSDRALTHFMDNSPLSFQLQIVVTATHGGCNYFAVQVHWQGNVISSQHTACC